MRRIGLVFLASLALFASACGGGGDDKKDASADVDANAGINSNAAGAAAAAAASKACQGREAVNFAASYASAMSGANTQDYASINRSLHAAADAAPSEIKADFTLVADTVGPFLELFASANGNYMTLAQNPEFQAKADRVGKDDVQQASQRVNAWFADHCS